MPINSFRWTGAPAAYLDLDLVKSYLRIDYADDDNLIQMMIQSATERCEAICNRTFISRTCTTYYDKITKRFELPRPAILSLQSLTLIYLNETIVLNQNSDFYVLDPTSDSFIILTATTYNLPAGFSLGDDLWRFNVAVNHTNGYDTKYPITNSGTQSSNVPMGIVEAILKTIGSAYYSPRANTFGTSRQGTIGIIECPEDARKLLQPYKNPTM